MPTSISRDALYAAVWADPMTTVAERYELSSNYLARICERLNIPRPPRGYWQQKAVGVRQDVPPLPEPDPGDELEWVRGVEPYLRHPPPPKFTGIPRRASRRPERPKTHPALLSVREDFEDSKVSRFDDDGYLKPKSRELPDLFVSKDTLRAALRIANQLFLELEDHGHWVRTAPPNVQYHSGRFEHRAGVKRSEHHSDRSWHPRPTLVFFGGVVVGLTLFEVAEEVEAVFEEGRWIRLPAKRIAQSIRQPDAWRVSRRFLPNGRLGLHLYAPYGWVNWTKTFHLSNAEEFASRFQEIRTTIETAAPEFERLYEEAERRHEEQQKKWAAERLEAERKRVDAEREKRLPEQVNGWRLAKDIREYVAEVKALVEAAGLRLTEGGKSDEELSWALSYADRIDPLSSWRKEIEAAKVEFSREATAQENDDARPSATDQNPTPEEALTVDHDARDDPEPLSHRSSEGSIP